MKTLILLLIPTVLLGCEDGYAKTPDGKEGRALLQTLVHDGHTFVIARTADGRGGASLVHHPSCECAKAR